MNSQLLKLDVIDNPEGVPLEQQARSFKTSTQADGSIPASKAGICERGAPSKQRQIFHGRKKT